MRILDVEYPDPNLNMAVDEAILESVDRNLAPSSLRFWRNINAVVIGCHQKVENEVNFEMCKKFGTTIVRRFTGGGAVYHDLGNLNWTIVLKKEDFPLKREILEIFRVAGKIILKSLKKMGVNGQLKSSNIYINGKKICGMAAYVKRSTLLCHGTLLINSDLDTMSAVLLKMKNNVTTLEYELCKRLQIDQVKQLIIDSVIEEFNAKVEYSSLLLSEKKLADLLYKDKYSTRQWIMRTL